MKKQIFVILTAIIILTAFYANVGNASQQASLTLQSSGIIQQTPTPTPTPTPNPTGTYSYIISISGQNYQMLNGATDQIMFQSTSSSQVFSKVVGNCPAGSSIDVESGTYTVDSMWTMLNVNKVSINFENGAELVAGNGLDTSVLMIGEPDHPSNNIQVNGITINGNAANQVQTNTQIDYVLVAGYPDGICISGSNDQIANANIYNCRVMGVGILWVTTPTFGANINSGVLNSKIYDCGWNGVIFYGGNANYLINSQIYGCSDVGVSCTGGSGNVVTGNYIHDMNGNTGSENCESAISIEGGDSDLITNNTIYNACIGISNSGWDNCIIAYNTISCSPNYDAPFGYGGSWAPDNPYVAGETWGIELTGTNNTIIDNTITGMLANVTSCYYSTGGDGIWLAGETSSYISGNIISQCQGYAIYANSGDGVSINNTLIGNTFSDNTNGVYDNNIPENTLISNS
jgi:hypothetical protein